MKAQALGAGAAVMPVVFNFLGYHFQAGPLIVAVSGVVIVRLMDPMQAGRRIIWSRELPVMAFCIFIAALLVQDTTSLMFAGLLGCGIGVLGVGSLRMIRGFVSARLQATLALWFGASVAEPEAPAPVPRIVPQDDDPAAIDAAVERLNREP